jgi:hypothetical protein
LVVTFLTWIRNQYDASTTYRNVPLTEIAIADAMNWLALVALLMAFISTLVVIVLFFTAVRRGWQFATAALAEGILTIAFWWALIPAVQ